MVCPRCKLTPKPGYFAIILRNGKEHFLKGNFITYSNYSPLVLLLEVGLYLKEYLSYDREFLPFFLKQTFDADDVAGKCT